MNLIYRLKHWIFIKHIEKQSLKICKKTAKIPWDDKAPLFPKKIVDKILKD